MAMVMHGYGHDCGRDHESDRANGHENDRESDHVYARILQEHHDRVRHEA